MVVVFFDLGIGFCVAGGSEARGRDQGVERGGYWNRFNRVLHFGRMGYPGSARRQVIVSLSRGDQGTFRLISSRLFLLKYVPRTRNWHQTDKKRRSRWVSSGKLRRLSR